MHRPEVRFMASGYAASRPIHHHDHPDPVAGHVLAHEQGGVVGAVEGEPASVDRTGCELVGGWSSPRLDATRAARNSGHQRPAFL